MVRRSKLGTYVSALCVFLGDAPRENVRAEACPPPAPRSPGDEPSPRVPRRGCARTLARSRALGARARPSKQVICNGNPDPKPETHTSAHTAHRAGCRGHLRLRGRAVLRRRGPGARRAAGAVIYAPYGLCLGVMLVQLKERGGKCPGCPWNLDPPIEGSRLTF